MALTTSMLRLEDVARDSTGRWKPGRSPNPLGRSVERAGAVDIAALARSHSVTALNTLVHCLRDPRYKLAAAIAILDRGYGKPPVSVHTDSQSTVLHLVAARELGDELLKSLTSPVVDGENPERPSATPAAHAHARDDGNELPQD